MTCSEFESLLHPYFDGEATPAERESADVHLAACEGCRAALEELRLTWQALDALPEPAAPAVSAVSVLARARKAERRLLWVRSAGGVAAVALVAVSLWSYGFFEAPPTPEGGWSGWEIAAEDGVDPGMLEDLELLQELDLKHLELLEKIDRIEHSPFGPSTVPENSENG